MKSTVYAYLLAGLGIISCTVTEISKGSVPSILANLAVAAVAGALGITVPGNTNVAPPLG